MTIACYCLILALTTPSLSDPAELAAHGIRAWAAPSFAAALALLRQWRFDVVLIDAGPGSLSAEVQTKLRRLGPPLAAPLLLWADAGTDPATLLNALRLGVADWLPEHSGVALLALKLLRLAAPPGAPQPPPGAALQIGPLSLLPQPGMALAHGLPLDLTPDAKSRSFCLVPIPLAMLLAWLAATAQAQDAQRVEITGSSIKRVDAETALPVQVITRADIQRSGAVNVEQLLQSVRALTSSGASTSYGPVARRQLSWRRLHHLLVTEQRQWPRHPRTAGPARRTIGAGTRRRSAARAFPLQPEQGDC